MAMAHAQHDNSLFPPLDEAQYRRLRDDISLRGVLVPVEICAETGQVLDGRARVRACDELGIRSYPRVVRAGLMTDEERDAHSRALNVLRRHLTPAARAEHIRALRAAGWSTRTIAARTGISQTTVVRDLRAGEPDGSPDKVVGLDGRRYAARRPTALTSVYAHTPREQQRAQLALEHLGADAPRKPVDLRRAERLARDAAAASRRLAPAAILPDGAVILCCDIRDLTVAGGSVDLLLTDPPYTGQAMPLWSDLGALAAHALRPGGLLIAYSGQMHLPEALSRLQEHLPYWWTFAALHVTGSGVGQVRPRNLGNTWKPLIAFRQPGAAELPAWSLDSVRGAGRQKTTGHPWQQSEDEARWLVEAFSCPGELVLDPFCGSGTVARAAIQSGRRVIACDVDAAAAHAAASRTAQP